MVRRRNLALMGFVMLNLSLEFHTVFQDLERQKFLMLMFLDARRSARCLIFLLVRTVLKLNFRARSDAFCRAMQEHSIYYTLRVTFTNSPRRETTSHILKIFRELCHSINIVVTRSLHLLHGMLSARLLVLMRIPSCDRTQEQRFLQNFS